ncbi:MAG: metallopeptidase TldD-related protein [Opitutaceae bacterium]|jgi:predicted Zn-dependent protease
MKFPRRSFLAFWLLPALCLPAVRAGELPAGATPVLLALQAELDHSFTALKAEPVPPYFLSYEVTENHRYVVSSTFGTLVNSTEERRRHLDIDLRVGDRTLDNTHPLRGNQGFAMANLAGGTVLLPIEDDPDAIRAVLWYQTDHRFKAAVEQLTKVKANMKVNVAEEDQSADFSAEPAEVFVQAPADLKIDRAVWEEKLRRYTAPFAAYGNIYGARASLNVDAQTWWYVNSEGARLQTTQTTARLLIYATTKADDGMVLPRYETFFAFTPDQLPGDAEVLARVERLIKDLLALRTAPVIDPYAGPAILSGRAAGVFFHEVFGHRVEGHRQKGVDQGQTFKKMLGQPVLPASFTVYCDPTLDYFGKTALGGYYLYDNQGVKARRVTLVEGGVLKGFLMARMPIEGFPNSNGHGRKAPGLPVVARQSNLIVETAQPVSQEKLKEQLLQLVQEQNKPYGLYVEDIEGGFTLTGRFIPNAFNVRPLMVYRVYPDGHEELVRGVDFIGTPLSVFSKVVAADDTPGIFNGICGAESGPVPVTGISPGLLLSQVEVQKKEKAQDRPPLLPAPLERTPSP